MTTPWVELYRPKNFDQIHHQETAVAAFRQCLKTGQLPHLLLFGPQGTGKTTCVQALAHQLFGPMFYKDRVFEINASSDRGVAVIRDRVKPLAQRKISAKPPADYQYPVPPIQLIVMEEADALTRDAQAALRRIIEDYSQNTRLVLLCNYPSQIIEPIVSRCAKFRFAPLPEESVTKRLREIAQMENLDVDAGTLRMIAEQTNGDLRRAVTLLQMVSSIVPVLKGKKEITVQNMLLLMQTQGICDHDKLMEIIGVLQQKDDKIFNSFLQQLIMINYDVEELSNQLFEELTLKSEEMTSEDTKNQVAHEFCKFGEAIARRADERLCFQKYLTALRVIYLYK